MPACRKGDDQSNARQAKALKAAGCQRVFEEAASGGADKRWIWRISVESSWCAMRW